MNGMKMKVENYGSAMRAMGYHDNVIVRAANNHPDILRFPDHWKRDECRCFVTPAIYVDYPYMEDKYKMRFHQPYYHYIEVVPGHNLVILTAGGFGILLYDFSELINSLEV